MLLLIIMDMGAGSHLLFTTISDGAILMSPEALLHCILWACCSLEILDHNSNTMVWHTCCFPGILELGLHYGSPWIISPHPEIDSTTAWAEIWIHGGQSCGSGLRDSHCLIASCGGAKMIGVSYTQRIGAAEWGGVRLLSTGVNVTGPMRVRQTRNSKIWEIREWFLGSGDQNLYVTYVTLS